MARLDRAIQQASVREPMNFLLRNLAGVFTLTVLLASCDAGVSRNEVSVVESPDRAFEAVLVEINGGATVDFDYEVDIHKKGYKASQPVARLYGAIRNQNAYGAKLKWSGDDLLHVQYLTAKRVREVTTSVSINGKQIKVVMESGMNDPTAPAGGMLYNLEKRHAK